jgi:hypothetical protein
VAACFFQGYFHAPALHMPGDDVSSAFIRRRAEYSQRIILAIAGKGLLTIGFELPFPVVQQALAQAQITLNLGDTLPTCSG